MSCGRRSLFRRRGWNYGLVLGCALDQSRARVRPAVFMASGALLLKPEKELTFQKLYTQNLPRILAALFFWAFCYKLVSLKLMDSLTFPDMIDAVKHLLLFHHEEHFYYLHITLLAYAALPIVRLFARYADQQLLKYTLVLWFLLGILYPTVRTFWPFTLLNGIPVQWSWSCGATLTMCGR